MKTVDPAKKVNPYGICTSMARKIKKISSQPKTSEERKTNYRFKQKLLLLELPHINANTAGFHAIS